MSASDDKRSKFGDRATATMLKRLLLANETPANRVTRLQKAGKNPSFRDLEMISQPADPYPYPDTIISSILLSLSCASLASSKASMGDYARVLSNATFWNPGYAYFGDNLISDGKNEGNAKTVPQSAQLKANYLFSLKLAARFLQLYGKQNNERLALGIIHKFHVPGSYQRKDGLGCDQIIPLPEPVDDDKDETIIWIMCDDAGFLNPRKPSNFSGTKPQSGPSQEMAGNLAIQGDDPISDDSKVQCDMVLQANTTRDTAKSVIKPAATLPVRPVTTPASAVVVKPARTTTTVDTPVISIDAPRNGPGTVPITPHSTTIATLVSRLLPGQLDAIIAIAVRFCQLPPDQLDAILPAATRLSRLPPAQLDNILRIFAEDEAYFGNPSSDS